MGADLVPDVSESDAAIVQEGYKGFKLQALIPTQIEKWRIVIHIYHLQ